MDFLNFTGRELGVLGSAGSVIGVTIYYVLKFQATFTSRLEEQSRRDQERIRVLELDLDRKVEALRREQIRGTRLTQALILRGGNPNDIEEM